MSSKSAEAPAASGETPPAPSSWSLTTRLALFSSLSSFFILAIVSVLMYYQLADHLQEQNSRYLRDEAEIIGQMARFHDFKESLAREVSIDHAGEEYLTHYIRLTDTDGRRVAETPGMADIIPPALFPPPEKDGRRSKEVTVQARHGSTFIATSLWIDTGPVKGATLQVALDVTNVDHILAGYRTRLAIALGVGFLLCNAVGLAIARRGTRTIGEITAKARQFTVSNLDERLSGTDWPRELNDMADALNGMLDRLQDSFNRLYNSVANLTHKLRTPITIIIGQAEVALAKERSAEELRDVIASSVEECDRLSRLINNILFISQAEIGKLQPIRTTFMAREEIDNLIEFYGPLAEDKGISVTCEGDATLSVDPALFRKAVANIFSNALTYTNPGGTVAVSARQKDDGSAEVLVRDTGRGIAEQELPKIFDRFYRVYDTRFMDPHGSGLGLPMVKTIMNLFHGTIEVRSRVGSGTDVVLTFPPQSS